MANQFLDDSVFAKSMLVLVKNRLVMGKLVDSSFKDQVTDQNGLKIQVKRPQRFVTTTGPTLQSQDIVNGKVDLEVNQYKGVHVEIGDLESVANYNELVRKQSMLSAASALAEDIDAFLHAKTLEFSNWVGTPGTAISSPTDFNRGWTRMEELAIPNDGNRCAVITSQDAANIKNFLIGTDIQGTNKTALERATIPMISDVDIYHSQKVASLTVGTRAASGATIINGAAQNVNYRDVANTMTQTLNVDGATAGHTYKKGEVFTIAGVFAVNPRDATVYPYLQQFTVMADATAGVGGAIGLTISPAIIVPGSGSGKDPNVNTAFATVNAAPADGAAVTLLGTAGTTYRTGSAFHKSAISLVFARLQMPFTGNASYATDPETGVTIRYWRGSDIATGIHAHRWDMIYGATNVDRLLGVRINGVP